MTTTTAIIPRPFTDAMSANDHKRQVEALATLGELGARVVTLTEETGDSIYRRFKADQSGTENRIYYIVEGVQE